jgi:hypothetical protein
VFKLNSLYRIGSISSDEELTGTYTGVGRALADASATADGVWIGSISSDEERTGTYTRVGRALTDAAATADVESEADAMARAKSKAVGVAMV